MPVKCGKSVSARGGVAIANHCAIAILLCVVNLLRFSIFITASVPTTADPNTCAKVSQYKWELHRDTNRWCIHYFQAARGHIFAKVSR